MARLFSSGFELGSLASGVEFQQNAGVGTIVTIDSSTVRFGNYSMKVAANGSSKGYVDWVPLNDLSSVSIYVRCYIYFTSNPSSIMDVLKIEASNGSTPSYIRLDTDGTLKLYGPNGQIGSASSSLSTNTWHMIELHTDSTPASGSHVVEGQIDGTVFSTSNIQTLGSIHFIIFGVLNTSSNGTYWMDDVAINDNSGSFQNAYPGQGQIVHLLPNGAGDNSMFTTQVGGTAGTTNNYTRVNEVTPDDSTSYNADNTLNDTDDFTLTSAPSSIGSTDNINVVSVGVRFSGANSVSEAGFKVRCKKVSGGTVSSSAEIDPNSTTWITNLHEPYGVDTYPLTLYQDPDSANWTKSKLNTAQIGYTISTGNTNSDKISTIWMLVESQPTNETTTSTSSTSSSSSSTSSTSSSTSSTSSSTSSTSSSTSSTSSSSSSTSSTSSSTSSTSSSTSSTSSSTSSTSSSSSSSSTSSTSSSTSSTSTSSTSSSTSTTQTGTTTSSSTSSTSSSSTSTIFLYYNPRINVRRV